MAKLSRPTPKAKAPMPLPKFRAGTLAMGFAAVAFTGAIYGAGLKTQQEWNEKRTEFREQTPAEQIAVLETQRNLLVDQRTEIETKMRQFEARVQEREAKKAAEHVSKSS